MFNVRELGQRIIDWALGYTTTYKYKDTDGQEGTQPFGVEIRQP